MNQFLSTWNELDLQRRVVLLGAIGLTFLAVLSLAQIATRPGLALLYSGLDPAAAEQIVQLRRNVLVKSSGQYNVFYPLVTDAIAQVLSRVHQDASTHSAYAGVILETDERSHFQSPDEERYWPAYPVAR